MNRQRSTRVLIGVLLEKESEMKYVRYFLCIVGAAFVSGALGALFGAAVAWLSPEFAKNLFASEVQNLTRYAAAVGMLWGLFLGTGAMAFCLLIIEAGGAIRSKLNKANSSGEAS